MDSKGKFKIFSNCILRYIQLAPFIFFFYFQFDLYNGKCLNLSESAEKFNNSVASISKFLISCIPLIFFKIFSRLTKILHVMAAFLQVFQVIETPWNEYMYLYPVMFYILFTLALELYIVVQNIKLAQLIDKLQVLRADCTKCVWVNVPASSLKIGDIIQVKRGEVAPADVILLDASEKYQGEIGAFFNKTFISGMKKEEFKTAVKNLKHSSGSLNPEKMLMLEEYLKSFNGRFTIELPNSNLSAFFANITLKSDPKKLTPSIENLVMRGSVLLSEWMVGLVVYTGFQTKTLHGHSFLKSKKPSFFRKYVIKCIIFILIIYAILVVLAMAISKYNTGYSITIWRYISTLLPIVPINLWFILECCFLLNKIIIERRWNKLKQNISLNKEVMNQKTKSKVQSQTLSQFKVQNNTQDQKKLHFKLLDIEAIVDFGLAEYAIFDKTGTIVTNEFEIQSICTLNKRYKIDQKNFEKRVSEIDIIKPRLRYQQRKESKKLMKPEPTQIEGNIEINKFSSESYCDVHLDENEEKSANKNILNFQMNLLSTNHLKFKNPFQYSTNIQKKNNENSGNKDIDNTYFQIKQYTPRNFASQTLTNNPPQNKFVLAKAYSKDNDYSTINKLSAIKNYQFEKLSSYITQPSNSKILSFNQKKNFFLISTSESQNTIGKNSVVEKDSFFLASSQKNDDQEISLNIQYQLEKDYKDDDLFNDINNADQSLIFLFQILSSCHGATVINDTNDMFLKKKPLIDNINYEEKSLIMFADKVGFSLLSKKIHNVYEESFGNLTLSTRSGIIEDFLILGILPPTKMRKRFSVVLANKSLNNILLICKSDPDSVINNIYWEEDSFSIYNKLLKKNMTEGLKTTVFCYKYLTSSEANVFKQKFKDAKTNLLNQKLDMEAIGLEFEKDLNYAGMVGIKDLIMDDAFYCIETFKMSGLKIWVLTGDNKINALNAALNSNILPKNVCFDFDFTSEELGKIAFGKIFEIIQNKYNEKIIPDFTFTIHGKSLSQIKKSQYLKQHFKFLLHFCSCVIGYSFQPDDKDYLVSILRLNKGSLEKIVVGIGDGINDYGMLKSANFGIQVISKASNFFYFGNVLSPNLKFISDLYQNNCKQFSHNIFIITDFLMYASMLQGFILFFQAVFISAGFPLYQTVQLFLDQNVMCFIPCILFVFINNPQKEAIKNSSINFINLEVREKLFSSFLYSVAIALAQAFIFVISIRLVLVNEVNQEGKFTSIEDLIVITKYFWLVVSLSRLIMIASTYKLVFVIITFGHFWIKVALEAGFDWINIKLSIDEFELGTKQIQTIIVLSALISFCIQVGIFFENFLLCELNIGFLVASKRFQSMKNEIENKNSFNNYHSIIQTLLLNSFDSYKKIDSSLQNILLMIFELKNNFALSKWLFLFSHKKQKHLHQIYFILSNVNYFRILIFIICIIEIFTLLVTELTSKLINFQIIVVVAMEILVMIFFVLFSWSWEFKYNLKTFFLYLLILATIFKILVFYFIKVDYFIILISSILIMTHYYNINFLIACLLVVCDITNFIIFYVVNKNVLVPYNKDQTIFIYSIFSYALTAVILMIFQCMQLRLQEMLDKLIFVLKSLSHEDVSCSKELLSLLMPEFILHLLKSYSINDNYIAEDAGMVSILFCDIAEFDSLINVYGPEIVDFLDALFRVFDTFCRNHGIQKIETVGKTYMACGGLRFVEESIQNEIKNVNYTKRILNLANDIIEYAENFVLKNGCKLKVKIGINHGNAMYGVIGYHKPQFSLIGDTVNTTSRLCTTGKEGHIMMSESAWVRIKSTKIRPEVILTEMKGKGMVKVYHIYKKKALLKTRIASALNKQVLASNNMLNQDIQKLIKAQKKISAQNNLSFLLLNKVFSNATKELKKNAAAKSRFDLYATSQKFSSDSFKNGSQQISSNTLRFTSKKQSIIVPKIDTKNFSQINHELNDMIENNSEKKKKNETSILMKINSSASIIQTIPIQLQHSFEFIPENSELSNGNNDKLKRTSAEFDIKEDEDEKDEPLKYHKHWLTFNKNQHSLVEKFFKSILINKKNQIRFHYFCTGFFLLATTLMSLLIKDMFNWFYVAFAIKIFFSIFIIGHSLFVTKICLIQKYQILSTFFCCMIHFTLILFIGTLKNDFSNSVPITTAFLAQAELIYFGTASVDIILFKNAFFVKIFTSVGYAATIFVFDIPNKNQHMFYLLISVVFLVAQKRNQWKRMIDFYNFNIKYNQNNSEITNFVDRLLPRHVQKNFSNPLINQRVGEIFDNVTLLFADIVGFTNYSAGKKPKAVVEMLSKLFTEFDKECARLDLYKVYTIGDCYVVMSFIDKDQRKDPAKECNLVVKMACSMISTIARVREQINFHGLHMRIGIHTGAIIGGIIGTDIVRYDIYGESVVTANKMESHGQPDQINVSEATMQLLSESQNSSYNFEFNTKIELNAYNKIINSYFLKSKTF